MGENIPGVILKLGMKKSWKSEELSKLLEEEMDRRAQLIQKKEGTEGEMHRLKEEGVGDVGAELEQLRNSFVSVKSLILKIQRSKIPCRIDFIHVFKKMEDAEELEKAAAYLNVLSFYQETSEQIEANLDSDLEKEAIDLFNRLKCIEISYLKTSECEELHKYGKSILAYWEHKLTTKLCGDLESLLETFGWPMRLMTATPTLESHEKLHRVMVSLSKMSMSGTSKDSTDEENIDDGKANPSRPMQILMVPLKRRFRFHFLSDKPTNESSRPEWYFSQVKQWLHDLLPFVKTHMEQVTVSEIDVSSVIEFVRCVTEMLRFKVEAHLNEDSRDGVFVKILEEAINYENDIGHLLVEHVDSTSNTYLPPFVDSIFSKPSLLAHWLEAERRACLEKLDDLFSSPSAWNKPVISAPAEIVDLFLAMIRSLTDRFAHLQQITQRLEFLQLVTDLLEDFHVRCLQTWKSRTEFQDYKSQDILIDFVIADALYCVHDTLQEWEYLPFFSALSSGREISENFASATENSSIFSLSQNSHPTLLDDDNPASHGLFTTACELYYCLADEIQGKWCIKVVKRLKEELQLYSNLKWQNVENFVPEPQYITQPLLKFIQSIEDIVKALSSCMDLKGVMKWMKRLAVKLDELLTDFVILPNRFCLKGINQLCYDLRKGIFPIFAEIDINDRLFFGSSVSALTVLQLSTGEALLLYDTLMNGNFEDHEVALAELHISICQSEVIKILRNRMDLPK